MNWRHIPADSVEQVICAECSHFPPTFEELGELAARHGYLVQVLPPGIMPYASVNHRKRIIDLSATCPEQMRVMLLHEVAEVLLRLPVAPEFHYRPSAYDEFHEVASIVERHLS